MMEHASSQINVNAQQALQELRSHTSLNFQVWCSNSQPGPVYRQKFRTTKRKLLSVIKFWFTSMFVFFTCLENIHKSVCSIQACTRKWLGMHNKNLWITWCTSDIQVWTNSTVPSFFCIFCHLFFIPLMFHSIFHSESYVTLCVNEFFERPEI